LTKNLTSKESIFAKCSRGDAYEFPCGDYGTFLIRPWNDEAFLEFGSFLYTDTGELIEENNKLSRAKTIQLSLVDESGNLIFDESELADIESKIIPVVKAAIYLECQRFVKLTDPEIEDAEKN
jgi:hypothetical protein